MQTLDWLGDTLFNFTSRLVSRGDILVAGLVGDRRPYALRRMIDATNTAS